jgi:hypothetical protein
MFMRIVVLLLALVSLSSQAQAIKESYAFAVLANLSTRSILIISITLILLRQRGET